MYYYDVNRCLVDENYTGQKWLIDIPCSLTPQANYKIVFDFDQKIWTYQSTDFNSWNSYLIKIGIIKPNKHEKIENNQIVKKTNEELLQENIITNEQYYEFKKNEVNQNFYNECKNIGVEFTGIFQNTNGNNISNPKFQYDDVSRSRLAEVKDDSRVNFWRSVNDEFIVLSNSQKNELFELMKLTYYTKFYEKSLLIDSL